MKNFSNGQSKKGSLKECGGSKSGSLDCGSGSKSGSLDCGGGCGSVSGSVRKCISRKHNFILLNILCKKMAIKFGYVNKSKAQKISGQANIGFKGAQFFFSRNLSINLM